MIQPLSAINIPSVGAGVWLGTIPSQMSQNRIFRFKINRNISIICSSNLPLYVVSVTKVFYGRNDARTCASHDGLLQNLHCVSNPLEEVNQRLVPRDTTGSDY